MKHVITEADVISVPVPSSTKSYKAIPNAQIIDLVKTHSRNLGYEISDATYRLNSTGQQMSAIYRLTTEDDYFKMMLGFYNSYDKSRRLGAGAGVSVNICDNGMILADFVTMRKHSGYIQDELDFLIYNAINSVRPQLSEAKKNKEFFEKIVIPDMGLVHELIGEMFLSEDLLKATQLTELSRKMEDPDNHFRLLEKGKLIEGKTAWDYYNSCTEVFKSELPIEFVDKHIDFHQYMKNKFATHDTKPELPIARGSAVPEVISDF